MLGDPLDKQRATNFLQRRTPRHAQLRALVANYMLSCLRDARVCAEMRVRKARALEAAVGWSGTGNDAGCGGGAAAAAAAATTAAPANTVAGDVSNS